MLAMGSREMPTKTTTVLIQERSGSGFASSPPTKPLADPKLAAGDKFWSWNSLAKKAKAVLLDDGICSRVPEAEKATTEPRSQKGEQVEVEAKCQKEPPVLQKGLGYIASSLSSLISDTVGLAIEEGLNIFESGNLENEKMQSGLSNDLQLKASRDIALAMASRAKMLLQELKTVKGDVIFLGNRCSQLEEENKRLRESMVKGVREEDDLVRLQLETLLKEKSRLQQENAQYARENQFLHEVVEYHQVALNRLSSEAGEQSMDGQEVEFFDLQPTIAGSSHACETELLCTKTNSLAPYVS